MSKNINVHDIPLCTRRPRYVFADLMDYTWKLMDLSSLYLTWHILFEAVVLCC